MIAKFWWGAQNGDMKIHGMKWEVMSRYKQEKGLRFREIQIFNKALLSNMATRVLKEPNALWIWVLMGIYFPSSDFLLATSMASWCWSSLHICRDVIREDEVWLIGDGSSVEPLRTDGWRHGRDFV